MPDPAVYPASDTMQQSALVSQAQYRAMYQQSISDPDAFWAAQAQRIVWKKPFTKVKNTSFDKDDLHIKWFEDGTLNVTESCLDRHAVLRGNDNAIIWEPEDEAQETRYITYSELSGEVNRLANGLLSLGIKRGDVVTIYMPMIPETVITMLACARIGAIHSVVFGGFSPDALAGRINDAQSTVVITATSAVRSGKTIPLKENIDKAIGQSDNPAHVNYVVVLDLDKNSAHARDIDYHELTWAESDECEAAEMSAEDPLFILYTSGSTGKPKGVVHTSGGYLVYASLTHEIVFNYRPGDIYWCAADVGWITGHSYIVYGPLCNGATLVMYEGLPSYPDVGRVGRIIDKHQVNSLYMAPTMIRALMADGDKAVEHCNLNSLQLLGSVGEPINPEAWRWYHRTYGRSQCPVVDTWWQTETGGMMITPLPGATSLKPGSANRPFFGVQPALVDEQGNELQGAASGNLIIKDSWPGQMRTVFGDHQRFIDTYFSTFPGSYFTGDGARRDEDGDYWITGRVDDVLNISGHRLGTAEIESALVAHEVVAEAAVIGYPHPIKGQGIYVYVTLNRDTLATEKIKKELIDWVRQEIGPIATPDAIQWAPGLPKTRSGKIMRRILRKIAADEFDELGDTSTLADPAVVEDLIKEHLAPGTSNS